MSKVEHIVSCNLCNEHHILEIDVDDFIRWKEGAFIQDVMPYLSVGERELMISGICESCFNKMFEVLSAE